ncbi:serine threonine- kinase [Paramuricea clavata]|uniref:Serine threonine- kinase n=1 Tax=Paramuricea clavata TaxID=317549 RepID=A0A6S7JSK9_PARCT|nr:serine threonine- kinase [Paramuricea clavata]
MRYSNKQYIMLIGQTILQNSYVDIGAHEKSMSTYVFSQVLPEKLEDVNQIVGAGTFGECHLKQYLRLGIRVVEKKLVESDLKLLYDEAYYMQLFSHRCVPHLIGIQTQIKPYSLITEFLGHGVESMTVYRLLFDAVFSEQKSRMLLPNWFRVCYDIVDAVHYIHQKEYLHCDLKSNNVLVSNQKGYLVDFGKVCKVRNPRAKKYKTVYPHSAPEVLNGDPVSKASDVFSYGKILKIIGEQLRNKELLSMGDKSF